MKKNIGKVICMVLVLILMLAALPATAAMAAKEMFQISAVAVTGIDAPLAGAKPDFTAEVASQARYELVENAVVWEEYDENGVWCSTLTANSTFKKGYGYVAFVTMKPKSGYGFAPSVTGTINGKEATVSASNGTDRTAYCAFQCTDTAITEVNLDVVMPVVGQTPTFAKVNTTRYHSANNNPKITNQTNGVVWTNMSTNVNLTVSNPFKKATTYAVTYTLYPKIGYQFIDDVKVAINGKRAMVRRVDNFILVRLENLTASYKTITSVAITGVTAPAVGKTPSYTLNAAGSNFAVQGQNDDRWVNGVAWVEFKPGASSGIIMKKTDTFKAGYTYKLYIDLVPTDASYAFVKDKSVVTVNGKNATVIVDDVNARAIYSFDTLSMLTVPGVSINCIAPAVGKTPNYTITTAGSHYSVVNQDSDYWANGVGWVEFKPGASSGNMMKKTDTFKAGNKYAIIMDVKVTTDGYAFVKNQTSATVNGKSATLNIDGETARLIYTFPALTQISVSKVDLNVTAPAAGEKPVFNKIEGTGYSSDNNGNPVAVFKNGIAWFKSPSSYIGAGTTETFEAGKDYTLKISLAPKDDYIFSKTLTATINGKTATVTQFEDGSVLLEVVLSTPKAPHTHTPSGWQTDDEYHWKVCTDTECGSIVSPKQMHLNTNDDGKCDTCGYQLPIEVPDDPVDPPVDEPTDPPVDEPTDPPVDEPTDPSVPADPTPTEPAPTSPAGDKDEDAAPNNGWVWIVLGAAVVILAVAVVLFVKKKK